MQASTKWSIATLTPNCCCTLLAHHTSQQERTMSSLKRMGLSGLAMMVAVSTWAGCMGDARDADTGELNMDLQIAPGGTISTVNYTIANTGNGFSRTGSVAVRLSNTLTFQTGAIPAADGYTISLNAVSADNAFTCT